ncbi:MAG: hypothetical protein ACRC68_13460, partial [Clostridium sp.]
RKNKKARNITKRILFIPISYIVAHLCIKGLNSSSYLVLRDLYSIVLILIPIYFILVNCTNIYKKIKSM